MDNHGNESWAGWRWTASGRYLVSPDGDHITAERLRGLAWRDAMELRLAGYASRRKAEVAKRAQQYGGAQVKVIVVELSDWKERHFGRVG